MPNLMKFGGKKASGNAIAADLLSGKTASVDSGDIVGSMPDKSGHTQSLIFDGHSTANRLFVKPPKGYYPEGSGDFVYVDSPGFVAANIKKDVNVFGKIGTYDPKFPSKVKFVQPGAAGTYIYNFGVPVSASLIRFLGSGGANASYDCKVEGSNDALNSNIVVLYNANLAGWGSQSYAYANLAGLYQWYRVTVTVVATATYNAHCFVLIPNGSVELG